jgi:hypothetical protein
MIGCVDARCVGTFQIFLPSSFIMVVASKNDGVEGNESEEGLEKRQRQTVSVHI